MGPGPRLYRVQMHFECAGHVCTVKICENNGLSITVDSCDRKAYVKSDEMMDFLKDIVSNAPDLGTEEVPQLNTQRRRSRWVLT